MRLTARFLIAALIAVVLMQTAAAAFTHTHDGDVDHIIGFVGDSNIVYGAARISMGTTPSGVGDVPIIAAAEGASIRWDGCQAATTGRPCLARNSGDYWQYRLPAVAAQTQPDVWIIELGINDTGVVGDVSTRGYSFYSQKIDWLLRLLPAGAHVGWTTLPCSLEPAAMLVGCRAVNAAIYATPQRWPNVTVIDWANAARDHPEYMVAPDQVHYSQAGYDAWTALVVSAID